MVRITSMALLACLHVVALPIGIQMSLLIRKPRLFLAAASALAVSAKLEFDATRAVDREHALISRQDSPPSEPPVEEPKPEEIKTANADLAVLLQKILDVMGSVNEDIKQGKVKLETETKLTPEEQKVALENIQKGIMQSAQTLVDIGKPLIEGEREGRVEPAPEAK
ncbi:hypothetical protein BBAD15_g4434 [Beauveria bassiana D1-5]|uniref:Uncharacterized protein n=1 Tax=Beauveria bassiana D1-5 TaxID=1245745 RepID=A0A0A2VV57_BEABA|nr:hypothetical protein BBAD15_g4434 [Beauveria bassiana D1-5]